MPDLSDEEEIFAAADGLKEDAPPPVTVEPEQEEEPTQEPEGQDADPDSGEPEGQTEAGQQREPQRIAYSRFKEVNEEKKTLRADLERREIAWAEEKAQLLRLIESTRPQPAQAQPQKEEPEEDALASFLSNPNDYLQKRLTPYQQQIAKLQDDILERDARSEHGAESVSSAEQWIKELFAKDQQEARGVYQRVKASSNPYSELVREHKRQTILSDIGNDPAAYRDRLREELRAELSGNPGSQQQIAQPHGTPRSAPPSLVRAVGNAGISEQGGITEADIFNAAPAFGKKRA